MPCVRIRGVVVPSSRALISLRLDPEDDGHPEFAFALRPWRATGGEPRDTRLRVTIRTLESLEFWSKQVEDRAVVELDAELDIDRNHARMIGAVRNVEDGELRVLDAKFGVDRVLSDPHFGVFRYDNRIDTYEVETRWLGRAAKLALGTNFGDVDPPLAQARAFFDDAECWDTVARETILRDLLPLKNEHWLDEDEAPFAPDAFLGRISIESISVDPGDDEEQDAYQTMYFQDGGLFGGHTIVVTIGIKEAPSAQLAG